MVMAISLSPLSSSLSALLPNPSHSLSPFPNPNSNPYPLLLRITTFKQRQPCAIQSIGFSKINSTAHNEQPLRSIVGLAASVVLFLGFGVRICSAASTSTSAQLQLPPLVGQQQQQQEEDIIMQEQEDTGDDDKLKQAFENWKSKTYALTVPLRIVSLQGSIPRSWVKDFIQSQSRRLKFHISYPATLDTIFSNLSVSLNFNKLKVKSLSSNMAAADLVSVGDSWLSLAIQKGLLEPIPGSEDQDWFKCLNDQWKVYLRRNSAGEIDPQGKIWAAPYRWGTMVIAYKKSKFQKHKLAPIEDWKDLWRPELAGRISMVNSPREVIGAVLKYMGASYNTNNMTLQVAGGRTAVQQNLAVLGKQVRLFDSSHYLKTFGVGDVWVAIGWSSDVLPAVKRMSNVAVVVPKSGASLWADLWAIPAASRLETNKIGGRVRGPSPLIHQWIEFCLQAARALPFKQEIIPGASPSALGDTPVQALEEILKGKPSLDTNLIAGVPPPEILSRCEFLEPLSKAALSDYEWLVASMQNPHPVLINRIQHYISSLIQNVPSKPTSTSN